MRIPSLLLVVVGFAACPPPIIEDSDVGSDSGTGTDVDTDTDTDTDTELVLGAVEASDQLVELTSVVVVDRVDYDGLDRFVVVHANADGALGVVLGNTLVTSGETLDVPVELGTPLSAGRSQLVATLYEDSNNNGVFDEDTDLRVDDTAFVSPFQATVELGTPAVRIVVESDTNGVIFVAQVVPALRQEALVALNTDNPAMSFARGLRYEIQNDSDVRLEFVTRGATADDDVVALAQGAVVGLAEDQAGINWADVSGVLRFNATASFLANVDGYRDGDDITAIRGVITSQTSR